MTRDATRQKRRNDESRASNSGPAKRKKRRSDHSSNQPSNPSSNDNDEHEEATTEADANILDEGNVEESLKKCRTALERVLEKMQTFEEKLDLMDRRLTEVQLNRSEASGPGQPSFSRRRNSFVNDKDSLFKESYENSLGKLKVRTLLPK